MLYRRLSPNEQTHVVEAFSFELGKVYEQTIKEPELQVQANVNTDLCEQVATGLGLSAPKGKPAEDSHQLALAGAVLAEPGRIDGGKIGIIADVGSDFAGVSKLVKATAALGVTALVIAPVGRVLKAGRRTVTVDRPAAPRRPPTSNSSCCSEKRSATARRWPHGAMAAPYSSLRVSPAEIPAWRWPRKSIRPSLRICRRRWVCIGPGTGPPKFNARTTSKVRTEGMTVTRDVAATRQRVGCIGRRMDPLRMGRREQPNPCCRRRLACAWCAHHALHRDVASGDR